MVGKAGCLLTVSLAQGVHAASCREAHRHPTSRFLLDIGASVKETVAVSAKRNIAPGNVSSRCNSCICMLLYDRKRKEMHKWNLCSWGQNKMSLWTGFVTKNAAKIRYSCAGTTGAWVISACFLGEYSFVKKATDIRKFQELVLFNIWGLYLKSLYLENQRSK